MTLLPLVLMERRVSGKVALALALALALAMAMAQVRAV